MSTPDSTTPAASVATTPVALTAEQENVKRRIATAITDVKAEFQRMRDTLGNAGHPNAADAASRLLEDLDSLLKSDATAVAVAPSTTTLDASTPAPVKDTPAA